MKVRAIELGDLFLASKIIKKIDIIAIFKKVGETDVTGLEAEEKTAIAKKKGMDIIMALFEHLDEADKEIMTLIGAWCGCTADEAKRIKLTELKSLFDQFVDVNGIENITSFFEQVADLTKQKS